MLNEQFVCFLGKYKTQLYDDRTQAWMPSSPGIGMHVEVKDPGSRVILSRHYAEEGRFVFTSHLPGEHSICIGTNSSRWYGGSQLVSGLGLNHTSKSCDYVTFLPYG